MGACKSCMACLRMLGIHLVTKSPPRLADTLISISQTTVCKDFDPLIIRHTGIPCPFKDIFIHEHIDPEPLKGRAHTYEIVSSVGKGIVDTAADSAEVSGHHCVSSEIAQIAPDVRLTIELLCLLPYFRKLAIVIQHDQPVLRHCTKECLYILLSPMSRIGIEEPSHLEPYSFRIDCRHRSVNMRSHVSQSLRIPARSIDFIERIHAVDMIRAEHFSLNGKEILLNFRIKRIHRSKESASVFVSKSAPITDAGSVYRRIHIRQFLRHMSCKSREYRSHAQLTFSLQYLLLQFCLSVYPFLWQRALPIVYIRHSVPREMGRT